MDWTIEPATEQQLTFLKRFGYVPERPLTRSEAAGLIREYQVNSGGVAPPPNAISEEAKVQAYQLRLAVQNARNAPGNGAQAAPSELELAISARQEFWLDTCRDTRQMRLPSPQVLELYKRYGCRFFTPTHEQAQGILDALDSAMPVWDRDHPELFYQTLELNHRDLLRRS